jgi:N-acetylmuramoyl-L-alanine amidase
LRGIKQQPLWVLDGLHAQCFNRARFLSNKEEGEFLNSEEGQDQMALHRKCIVAKKKKIFRTGWALIKQPKIGRQL